MTPLQISYKAARKLDEEAIAALVTAIMPTLPTGLHARRHMYRIMRNYMLPIGERATDRSLMTGTGWTMQQLQDYKARVFEFLVEIRASLKQVA